mmetsp:Transcript_30257/g.78160  ORF Transcript_30257/g.78160 Transcript_30257/m.78160 type:complete len:220 (-) Transcript_30257:114-773(-)
MAVCLALIQLHLAQLAHQSVPVPSLHLREDESHRPPRDAAVVAEALRGLVAVLHPLPVQGGALLHPDHARHPLVLRLLRRQKPESPCALLIRQAVRGNLVFVEPKLLVPIRPLLRSRHSVGRCGGGVAGFRRGFLGAGREGGGALLGPGPGGHIPFLTPEIGGYLLYRVIVMRPGPAQVIQGALERLRLVYLQQSADRPTRFASFHDGVHLDLAGGTVR